MLHAASDANVAATMSNAEASQLNFQAPNVEATTISKPVLPSEATPVQPSEPASSGDDVSLQQEAPISQEQNEVKVNGHANAQNTINSTASTSFADSGLPDSLPSAIPSSDPAPELASTIETLSEPAPLPESAPVSDLRTEPHSDNLPPEAVANVEAIKHEMDNNADSQVSPIRESKPEPTIETQPIAALEDTGIPTPQSPPPPPEPAHATLPTQPSNAAVVPSIEAMDTTVSGVKPVDPAPTPVVPDAAHQDQEMTDAPAQPVKAAREREEDTADEPAAKRFKPDEDKVMSEETSFKIPESPAPAISTAPAAAPAEPVDADDTVTPLRLSHMKKVISNLKKSNASAAFRVPVDWQTMKIPTYPEIVKSPMDLGTIDARLKKNEYHSVQAFKDDFAQIVTNCVLFNGPDHSITQQGRKMESSFQNQMQHLPPTTVAEPSKAEKKAAKPKIEPIRQPAPRRSSVTGKPASPKAPSPATFAPDPNGMPLIRRDSTVDGRPKRAIVPPKRNSDFGGARPKKKKYELELRFCDEVLKIISSPKHWTSNQYFTHPVDPVALNIPTYFQVIKKPMDLGTVRQKLDGGMYEKAKDFEEDVRQIFKNCYKFNQEGDYVYSRGAELEKLFSQEWTKKQDWIAAREPDSEPASVGGDDDDEESDEEPEAESEEDDQSDQLKQLQAQLDLIKNQMGQLQHKKKKASPGVIPKKADKNKNKKATPTSKFPGLVPKPDKTEKSKKKKTPKPEKDRYVTFAEKQYISNGIAMLPERPMSEALRIIQNSVPALANSDQGEIELDIEEVPNHALLKLLSFVKKYAGPPPEEAKDDAAYSAPAAGKAKKSKSMSKQDQEAQIAELKGQLHHYEAGSPDALQSIETGAEDSDDDDSNEESEEE